MTWSSCVFSQEGFDSPKPCSCPSKVARGGVGEQTLVASFPRLTRQAEADPPPPVAFKAAVCEN